MDGEGHKEIGKEERERESERGGRKGGRGRQRRDGWTQSLRGEGRRGRLVSWCFELGQLQRKEAIES